MLFVVDFLIVVVMVEMVLVDCLVDPACWYLEVDHSCLLMVLLACLCRSSPVLLLLEVLRRVGSCRIP